MNCTMMDGSIGMMLVMGSTYLLFVIMLILIVAALIKYLLGKGQNDKNVENSDA